MSKIEVKAWAKLNLSLDVAGKREDGYHELTMVMQTVSLCDDVSIELTPAGVSAFTSFRFIPNDERNLAVKAAEAFFAAAGISSGARISINKRIPVGSGMGGGSSDAAAVLRGLNELFGGRFTPRELEDIGARVGSDVPFCVRGGTQLARGRGELLSPLPPLPDCHIVICKPDFSISTPELYRKLDAVQIRCRPDTQGIISALGSGDLAGVARRMYNVFESVPDRRRKSIAAIRSSLLDRGALGSVMTGSGSAVFGIFAGEDAARAACSAVGKNHGFCCQARNIPADRV
jgi:4-diphosphocytidyl-2-C-methyl-D-erythritol kinase